MKSSLSIFAFAILFALSCKKEAPMPAKPDPIYYSPIDATLQSHFNYKILVSYWIYRDSVNGITDSFYLSRAYYFVDLYSYAHPSMGGVEGLALVLSEMHLDTPIVADTLYWCYTLIESKLSFSQTFGGYHSFENSYPYTITDSNYFLNSHSFSNVGEISSNNDKF